MASTRIACGWKQAVSCFLLLWLATSGAPAETRQYGYDSLRRLTSVKYGDGTVVHYVYDSAGNRLVETVARASAPANSPPGAPGNPLIANGATDVSTTASLGWQLPTDPDSGDVVNCYLYLGTSQNPPLVASGPMSSWNPGRLRGHTTYYWYVVARDGRNAQTAGPLWSFTTGNDLPEPDFFAFSTSGWAPLKASFYDRSLSRDDAIVAWEWDFGNDGSVDSRDPNPVGTFLRAGIFPVKLTVTDAHGGKGSITKPSVVQVLDQTILDLAPVSLALDGAAPYRHIGVVYSVTNLGTQFIDVPCEWEECFYASTNAVFDHTARYVGCFHESAALLPGSQYTRTNVLTLPAEIDSHFYLFLKVDGGNAIPEINEANNLTRVPLNLPAANLLAERLVVPTPLLSGQRARFAWQVANRGGAPALGPWRDEILVSTNSVFDWGAQSLGSMEYETNLAAGASYWATNEVVLPRLTAGTYYFYLKADTGDTVFETEEGSEPLRVAAQVIIGPQPDLAPLKMVAPNPLLSGQTMELAWAITNQGTAPALARWSDYLCLSTQAVWDVYAYVNFLGSFDREVNLAPGAIYWTTNRVQLPRLVPGNYHLLVFTEAEDDLFERDENNNVLATPVSVQLGAQPDLIPARLTVPSPLPSGQRIDIVMTVTNQGAGLAQPDWLDGIYLSTNATFEGDGILALNFQESAAGASASYQVTNTVQLPRLEPGSYYLYAATDLFDQVFEGNETNNLLRLPVTVSLGAQPDLVPLQLIGPPSLTKGQIAELTFVITNQGPGVALAPWQDIVYFSSNSFWDITSAAPIAFNLQETNLPPKSSCRITSTFVCPNVKAGTYYFFLVSDAVDQMYELGEDNNLLSVPVVVAGVASGPDLAPVSLVAPDSALPGTAIQVSYTVTNTVSAAASGPWMDSLWLSEQPSWDSTATFLAYQLIMNPLPGRGSYSQTATLNIPAEAKGSQYLILQVNGFDQVAESDADNNFLSVPIQIGTGSEAPDLKPSRLSAPASAAPGKLIDVSYAITNQGSIIAAAPWFDQLVLSRDTVWDEADHLLIDRERTSSVAAGREYTYGRSVTLPDWAPGAYYLILKTDVWEGVEEASEGNNSLVVPIGLGTSAPTRFTQVQLLPDGKLRLVVEAAAGQKYSVLVSTNLVVWDKALEWTCPSSPATLDLPASPAARAQFYRLSLP